MNYLFNVDFSLNSTGKVDLKILPRRIIASMGAEEGKNYYLTIEISCEYKQL